ncbi:MAG TPA: RagB/SusD family nutrient uptake outer membrane protein [Ohtaekwangia sp.]|uniref:RagB/SusD family nutrient uptake outer membrane protein n=1 Tax=Ohtaekwangia sp. TaxID=2066019 RepID=UPI002F94BE60
MKKIYMTCRSVAVLLLGFIVISCQESFLDREPLDTVTNEDFYQTSEQVLAATAPLYNIVWYDYNTSASYGIGDARGGAMTSIANQMDNILFRTNGATEENSNAWHSLFNVIGQANAVINDIATYTSASVPESTKQYATAEARFMRGLAYSYLVQNWGAVPIITNNAALLQDTSITRNTVETVWEFVIRDIRYAAKTLPTAAAAEGRLTKYAAQGMLAKMFLTRAGISGTRSESDLDSAAYYAKQVINNSGATLLTDYEELFKMKNNNNSEGLVALQWIYNGTWGTQNSVQSYLAYSSDITSFSDGWGGDLGASYYLLEKYVSNDKRRKATFMYPGDHYSYIHQKTKNAAGDDIVQELHVPQNNGSNSTRAWIKKYVVGRPEDNDGKVLYQRTGINTYMLRLADVYLVYAEAILGTQSSTSDGEALKYFNAVRLRAGLTAVTSITWDDIFEERALEFAMEGQLWYDFVRLHYYDPEKAYTMLSNQERGYYTITPVYRNGDAQTYPDPIDWTVAVTLSQKITASASNFIIPIPTTELERAPNLKKEPVPYVFD